MTDEAQLREKLRKIEALFAGADTVGEKLAAEAALERVRARLAELGAAISCRILDLIRRTVSARVA